MVMNSALEQISPETAAMIEAQARRLGISADEYLRRLLPASERDLALAADTTDEEFERDMILFAEGTDELPAYNGTYSREDIYFDHN
jgi:hypothetical protein